MDATATLLSATHYPVRVQTPDADLLLGVAPGLSLREALDATAVRVRAACGGQGSCGACALRVLGGVFNPPTSAERLKLSRGDLEAGWRLACQLRPRGAGEVLIEDPARPSGWRSLTADAWEPAPGGRPELDQSVFGLAVDLGTTHVRVALWDRRGGRRIATRVGRNPQGVLGADVLTRLDAARTRPGGAAELAKLARGAVLEALRDILARDLGEVTPMLREIGRVLVVGNTAMLTLLTEGDWAGLYDPDNWQRPIPCTPADPDAWQAAWQLPRAQVLAAPPLAGFIGSDLLSAVAAAGLDQGPAGAMLLDVGTNTEVALWDGHTLLASAVPGGPAFEGVGLRNGMAAERGAVDRVTRDADGFHCRVIGGGPARGLCGSGLVDAVAALLSAGLLKFSGRFVQHPGPDGFPLDPGNPRTAVTAADVDLFQRAKAATAAALEELLVQAGMGWNDVTRLSICGTFGRYLGEDSARALGLLPDLGPERLELLENAALRGCEGALLAPEGEPPFARLRAKARVINLSFVPGYEDRFIRHLRLCPIPLSP